MPPPPARPAVTVVTDCGAVRCCRPRIRSRQTWPWPSRRRRLPSRSTPPFVEGSRQCPPQLLLWTFLRATRFLLVTADGCCGLQGGGALSSQLLTAIDAAGADRAGVQLYNYGGLDTTPSTSTKEQKARTSFWLLPMWAGKDRVQFAEAMTRVAGEILTTFATSYTAEVGLAQAVTVDALQTYAKQETGKKYLLNPQLVTIAKL